VFTVREDHVIALQAEECVEEISDSLLVVYHENLGHSHVPLQHRTLICRGYHEVLSVNIFSYLAEESLPAPRKSYLRKGLRLTRTLARL
jgi:hypothetical protein